MCQVARQIAGPAIHAMCGIGRIRSHKVNFYPGVNADEGLHRLLKGKIGLGCQ